MPISEKKQRFKINILHFYLKKPEKGTSLVVQWLRTHLPMQGTRFDPWSGKIPRAAEQLSPCATITEPALYSP